MYHLPYFKAKDAQEVFDFMKANPFVVLCGVDKNNKPVATHVPVLLEEREGALFLLGHIMRQTDHHKAFAFNKNVVAIFNSAHTYVSASWYTNPRQGSTWNYITVHAEGELKFLEEQKLIEILKSLTTHFEDNANSPAGFDNLPKEYVERLVKAIIAFEIKVTGIENVFKLSQNRDEKSYENIIEHLSEQNADAKAIASIMKQRQAKVFTS